MIVKTAWYWQKTRHTVQWNRIDNPKIRPQAYGQVILDKGARNTQWRRKHLQQIVLDKLNSPMQKNETRLQFVPMYKNLFKINQRLTYKI